MISVFLLWYDILLDVKGLILDFQHGCPFNKPQKQVKPLRNKTNFNNFNKPMKNCSGRGVFNKIFSRNFQQQSNP